MTDEVAELDWAPGRGVSSGRSASCSAALLRGAGRPGVQRCPPDGRRDHRPAPTPQQPMPTTPLGGRSSYRPDHRAVVAEGATVIELGPLDLVAADQIVAAMTADDPLSSAPARRRGAVARRRASALPPRARRQRPSGGNQRSCPTPSTGSSRPASTAFHRTIGAVLRTAAVLGMAVDLRLLASRAGRGRHAARSSGRPPRAARVRARRRGQVDASSATSWSGRRPTRPAVPASRRARTRTPRLRSSAWAGGDTDQQADLLSLHCFHGKRFGDAWRYSVLTAERARATIAYADAAVAYERALASARRQRADHDIGLAAVHESLGDVVLRARRVRAGQPRVPRRIEHPGSRAPEEAAGCG